ncbi:glutamate synthase [Achromatium sp. WMS2]|nr:glutamate synthase [Achromatium sp. WMS2]
MGKTTGFMEFQRVDRTYSTVPERIVHYDEFVIPLSNTDVMQQGSRCMDCGIPFCHNGCPVNNLIPDWNDLVYRDQWRAAIDILHATNNFPEFTGRICPAPCEAACTLNISEIPVTIKTIECAIVDKAWQEGWITPQVPERRSGKCVAIVGSGPAGLAAAQQLARAGHKVTVFEKHDRIGGLLRYGIPDFKLNKALIDRRISQMLTEGVEFHTNAHVGTDVSVAQIRANYHAVILAGGAEQPRDITIPGRELSGVYFALDFLRATSKRVQGVYVPEHQFISAEGKNVLVIGGGDTGSDCIGTANRHGARSVTQIEILPKPPAKEHKALTWPHWPNKLRTTSSHEEGCERLWSIDTKVFLGDKTGQVRAAVCVKVDWSKDAQGRWNKQEVPNSEFEIPCELVTLATGFLHPVHTGLLSELQTTAGLEFDARGNVQAPVDGPKAYHTPVTGVFAAGDMRRGQSLVVWAIREGRQCARAVDYWLMGHSNLPK